MPLVPQQYDNRIKQQRQRIQRHPGDDSRLRHKLNKLKVRRYEGKQAAQPPEPMPWNAEYETTTGKLDRDYNYEQGNIAADELNTQRAYGFTDSSDPFSRARQLQENFQNANRGTLNNYAASGQLYAGSLNNARGIDRQNFEQGWDTSKKEYDSTLMSLQQRRLEAQRQRDEGKLAAEAQRLEDAAAERVDPAEAPPPPRFVRDFYRQQKKAKGQPKPNKPNRPNNRRRK